MLAMPEARYRCAIMAHLVPPPDAAAAPDAARLVAWSARVAAMLAAGRGLVGTSAPRDVAPALIARLDGVRFGTRMAGNVPSNNGTIEAAHDKRVLHRLGLEHRRQRGREHSRAAGINRRGREPASKSS